MMARPRTQPKTPEGKAASLRAQSDRVRKRYKVNVTKRRKFTFEGEDELVKNMIVVLKLANYTNSQIAMIVGVSRGQVKEILEDGNVQKQYLALKERLPQAALDLGRTYLIEAVQAVANVMRTSTDDNLVLKAASELFDRFGIPKVSRSEQKVEADDSETGGHPVTPSLMEKLRQASPEVQAAAADLQEMFQSGIEQLLNSQTDEKVNDGDS